MSNEKKYLRDLPLGSCFTFNELSTVYSVNKQLTNLSKTACRCVNDGHILTKESDLQVFPINIDDLP